MGVNMIRVMQLKDVPRVAEIHVFGWRCAYRGIVSDEFLFNKMIVTERAIVFDNAVHNHTEETYVFDDGIIKAFLTIGVCRDADKPDSYELWGIYVDPFMKRQGIGTKMVDYCKNIAIDNGFQEICLWVLEKNTDARLFYEKQGYYPDGTKKFIDFLAATEIRYSKKLLH
jgi:ribosomal protein S18 acetylase RimI-like enzyme